MAIGSSQPWTSVLRLDESSSLRTHRYADRFSVVRVETTGPLPDAIQKSSSVPALLVSTFVRPVAAPNYRLWVDGKIVPTGPIPAFRVNVVDLGAEPAMWGGRGVDYVHFHVRRGAIDETAEALGYERLGDFRLSVAQEDIVLAQLTKTLLPFLGSGSPPPPLALDHLELILAAHVIQRYGPARQTRGAVRGGRSSARRKCSPGRECRWRRSPAGPALPTRRRSRGSSADSSAFRQASGVARTLSCPADSTTRRTPVFLGLLRRQCGELIFAESGAGDSPAALGRLGEEYPGATCLGRIAASVGDDPRGVSN